MINREKVIKGLQIERECVSRDCDRDCGKCDLVQEREWLLSVYDDALDLLKEQETEDTGSCRIFQCKKCGFGIDDIFVNDEEKYQIVPRYCPNCGRSVRRE